MSSALLDPNAATVGGCNALSALGDLPAGVHLSDPKVINNRLFTAGSGGAGRLEVGTSPLVEQTAESGAIFSGGARSWDIHHSLVDRFAINRNLAIVLVPILIDNFGRNQVQGLPAGCLRFELIASGHL